jgi:hypothetical protein
MWRSLVAHFVRDEGAAGSNPVIPIFNSALRKLVWQLLREPDEGAPVAIAFSIGFSGQLIVDVVSECARDVTWGS